MTPISTLNNDLYDKKIGTICQRFKLKTNIFKNTVILLYFNVKMNKYLNFKNKIISGNSV